MRWHAAHSADGVRGPLSCRKGVSGVLVAGHSHRSCQPWHERTRRVATHVVVSARRACDDVPRLPAAARGRERGYGGSEAGGWGPDVPGRDGVESKQRLVL